MLNRSAVCRHRRILWCIWKPQWGLLFATYVLDWGASAPWVVQGSPYPLGLVQVLLLHVARSLVLVGGALRLGSRRCDRIQVWGVPGSCRAAEREHCRCNRRFFVWLLLCFGLYLQFGWYDLWRSGPYWPCVNYIWERARIPCLFCSLCTAGKTWTLDGRYRRPLVLCHSLWPSFDLNCCW